MTRKIGFSFIILFFISNSYQAICQDMIGIPGPIQFNKNEYLFNFSESPKPDIVIQTYLPKGEKFETYNQLMTIHLIKKENVELEVAVNKQVKNLNERKKSDHNCQFNMTEDKNGDYFILDFLTTEMNEGKISLAEYNVYKYQRTKVDNRNAIIVYAYTWRSYDEETKLFITSLDNFKNEFINEMMYVHYLYPIPRKEVSDSKSQENKEESSKTSESESN